MVGLIRYEIQHVSRYFYDGHVRNSVMALCLMPRDDSGQRLRSFSITTNPPSSMNTELDSFGNTKHVLNIHRGHETLELVTRASVETSPSRPRPLSLGPGSWEEVRSSTGSFLGWDFTHDSAFIHHSPALADFIERAGIKPAGDPLESALALSDTLFHVLQYVPGSTSAVSTIEQTLESGEGVCQDYTHIMIAIARSWGLPARYVSGYLYVTGQTDEQAIPTARHAWVECWFPGLGCTGFDPTNHCLADHRHIRIAVGRDYRDVTPVRGVLQGGAEARLEVDVQIDSVPA